MEKANPVKAKLYKHQEAAVEFALEVLGYGAREPTSKAVAILAEMGCGKTLITLALAGRLQAEGHIKKMLVVCPKSIVGVWESEFAKFADFPYTLEVLEGSMTEKAKALERLERASGLKVAVVNYESAWRMEAELAGWQPCMIVCDESSKIKNPQAKQSKALHRLGRLAKHTAILSGTPIVAQPVQIP
jgi:SNF2 family DNA or RNA helicase